MITLLDYCKGIICLSFLIFSLTSLFFMWRPPSAPRSFLQDNYSFNLTYCLYAISYSFAIQLKNCIKVIWKIPPEGTILVLFVFSLVDNYCWCPPRFQAAMDQSLLKAQLFAVIFIRWYWKLEVSAVLDCCVICTLHFSTFPTKNYT